MECAARTKPTPGSLGAGTGGRERRTNYADEIYPTRLELERARGIFIHFSSVRFGGGYFLGDRTLTTYQLTLTLTLKHPNPNILTLTT